MAKLSAKPGAAVVPSHVKPLRILLYVLTAATAAAALFLEPALQGAVKRGALSGGWLFTPLAIYGIFFVVYAADRAMLVRRAQYPAGRAFFQVAFGVVFGLLLLPSTIGAWKAQKPEGVEALLRAKQAEVRLVAVEALGYRGRNPDRARWLGRSLQDADATVRTRAAEILSSWSGRSVSDVEGLSEWSSTFTETSTGAP